MKINNFKGYRYRRYALALRIAAIAWFPYAAHTYFIYPSWVAFAAAVLLASGGCIPLWILASHCDYVARDSFATRRLIKMGEKHGRSAI